MGIPFISRPRRALWVAAAVLGTIVLSACAPVTVLNDLVTSRTYRLDAGIAYGSQPRQQLDVYRPLAERTATGGRPPLVVFFYGGTWTHGNRADYKFLGEALAARGAVVVLPDYRLSPQATYPAFVQDSALATKWALDNAERLGADPARVYVMGHSAGAYMAAMLALDGRWLKQVGAQPKQLAGWIGLAGPYDFLPIGDPETQVAFNWPNTPASSQPLAHVTAASPPTLLMVGKKDEVVDPQHNTEGMAEKLRAAGVPVQLREYDQLGHVGLMAAFAEPLHWIGGPVLPPVLGFIGLPVAAPATASGAAATPAASRTPPG